MLGPLAVLTCLAVVVFTIASRRFALAIGAEVKRPRASVAVGILAIIGAAAPFCLGAVSYHVLYPALWVALLAAFVLVGGPSKRSMLAANTCTLCLMLAISLLHFGHLSMSGLGEDDSPFWRGLLIAGSLALASAYLFALVKVFKGAYPKTERADQALQSFQVFACFAIAYELLDLTPSRADMEFNLLPTILLGSTLLATVACGAFAFVASRLGAEAFREAENRALERKRKDQETRLRLYLAQASTDELTKLATRRVGQEQLNGLEAQRRPYVLAFIDVDGLKKINDEQGHLRGDEYLIACARALLEAFPENMVVRWGGDEFLIIDERLQAEQVEARLADVEQAGAGKNPPIRFSFGVIACSPESETAYEAIQRADDAMYAAKRARRKANEPDGPEVSR